MIKLQPFKPAFLMPSRYRGIYPSRFFGSAACCDGWPLHIVLRPYISSFLYNSHVTFGNSTGLSRNPSSAAFYRVNRWVKR